MAAIIRREVSQRDKALTTVAGQNLYSPNHRPEKILRLKTNQFCAFGVNPFRTTAAKSRKTCKESSGWRTVWCFVLDSRHGNPR
jgi:hypothetical protein